jgi:hypothetical protein
MGLQRCESGAGHHASLFGDSLKSREKGEIDRAWWSLNSTNLKFEGRCQWCGYDSEMRAEYRERKVRPSGMGFGTP